MFHSPGNLRAKREQAPNNVTKRGNKFIIAILSPLDPDYYQRGSNTLGRKSINQLTGYSQGLLFNQMDCSSAL